MNYVNYPLKIGFRNRTKAGVNLMLTTYPINEQFEKRSIMYTLKLATTLHTEIKNTKSIDELTNEYFGLYFKPIYIFLYNWHIGNIDFEIEKEKLPRGFNNLLSDALQWAKTKCTKYYR